MSSDDSKSIKPLILWGQWSLRRPWLILFIVLFLAAISTNYAVNNLSINTDTAELIAPDAPFQQNRRKFEQAFAQDMHTLLLVVESDAPELTKAATKRLSRLLSADKVNFKSVYIPNDNEFFRKNGLMFLDLNDLQIISSNLAQAQPFIGRISEQPNLSGFLSILNDALKNTGSEQSVPLDLAALIQKVTQSVHKSINGENSLLSWEDLIAEKKISVSTPKSGFIIVLPIFDYTKIRPAENAIEAIRKKVAEVQDPNLPAVKVWVTGEVGLEDDELLGMSTGTFTATIFSIVLVVFILLFAYRSFSLALATLMAIALGMGFCAAFAAASVHKLNLISVAFAVSNIGLGVEYAIHFCLRYRDSLLIHIDKRHAIGTTLVSTSPSLLLCAGTTAIGLYSFIPTDYQGVSELGLLAGTSLFICLLVTLLVLPALLTIFPAPVNSQLQATAKPQDKMLTRVAGNMALFVLRSAKPITYLTGVLAVIAVLLTFKVQTDFNPINLRDPKTDSVIAFKNLLKNKETSPMTLTVLARSEAETKELQRKLAAVKSVDKTVSLFDFMPSDQEDKLAYIEEMAMILGTRARSFPALIQDADPVPMINSLISTLDNTIAQPLDPKQTEIYQAFKHELQDILLELSTRQEPNRRLFIEKIQTTLIGTLPSAMNELYASFDANEITLAEIPPEVKERWLSKNGLYRIQIYPKKDLNNLADLQEFITDVQAVAPDTTDLPIMYWESMKEVLAAFKQAIITAMITIALLLLLIRRNVIDMVLVLIPLVLSGVFTMASSTLAGIPINFANIIALPLLLGLGVDNGIHMVEKLRHSLGSGQNIYQSSTSRAMFYGALTTSSSFAGLAFSPHQGIASMGAVITLGIFWIMACTFIILPAIGKLVLTKAGHYQLISGQGE